MGVLQQMTQLTYQAIALSHHSSTPLLHCSSAPLLRGYAPWPSPGIREFQGAIFKSSNMPGILALCGSDRDGICKVASPSIKSASRPVTRIFSFGQFSHIFGHKAGRRGCQLSGEAHDTGQQGILGCGKLFIGNAGHKGHKGGGAHSAAQVLKSNHTRQHGNVITDPGQNGKTGC